MTDGPKTGGIGLCLAGGGVTGAMYQVGCLAALEDGIEGFDATQFDVFVGSSSGATPALALAGGITAGRLYRALLDPADDFFPLRRQHLLQFDGSEWKRVIQSAWGAARRFVASATYRPTDINVWDELDRFWDSLPAGLFSLDPFEQFMTEFMVRRGIPFRFEELPRTLRLVAIDLDAGERAFFGEGELAEVAIPRALAASSATPTLFAPVRVNERDFIDGGIGAFGHADVAERLGCKTILVVNAMVPIRIDPASRDVPTGHGRMKRVRDKGLLWVYQQAWRIRTEARLREGLERFREQRRGTQVVLLEPDPNDATMFMHSPMNFAARRAILEDGYKYTTRLLRDPSSELHRALAAHGYRVATAAATAGSSG